MDFSDLWMPAFRSLEFPLKTVETLWEKEASDWWKFGFLFRLRKKSNSLFFTWPPATSFSTSKWPIDSPRGSLWNFKPDAEMGEKRNFDTTFRKRNSITSNKYIESNQPKRSPKKACICQRAQNRGSVFGFFHWRSCSKCYAMDCFGTYFPHAQTCDVSRVQLATEWTASVNSSHMSKPVM